MRQLLTLALLLTSFSISFAQIEPELFTPVSTPLPNRDLAISPDGNMMLSTIQSYKREISVIVISLKTPDGWSKPQVASFSGKYSDLEPAFSPDGKRLYFASNRPPADNPEKRDYDIFYVEKGQKDWSAPVRLPEVINTSGNEFYPSLAADGSLYFTATYESGKGTEDIYVSRVKDGTYQAPESLSEAVNSKTYEFNAFVAPDQSYLIFSSFGRPDGLGGGDLYISFADENGNWKPAKPLPKGINSTVLDYCPFVDHEGNFYFTSAKPNFPASVYVQDLNKLPNQIENGLDNIYKIEFSVLAEELAGK